MGTKQKNISKYHFVFYLLLKKERFILYVYSKLICMELKNYFSEHI
jgi:hypothetical protein